MKKRGNQPTVSKLTEGNNPLGEAIRCGIDEDVFFLLKAKKELDDKNETANSPEKTRCLKKLKEQLIQRLFLEGKQVPGEGIKADTVFELAAIIARLAIEKPFQYTRHESPLRANQRRWSARALATYLLDKYKNLSGDAEDFLALVEDGDQAANKRLRRICKACKLNLKQ